MFAEIGKRWSPRPRALDRVLMHGNYVVPQWYLDIYRTARWDRFGHPENIPEFTHGFPTIWWYDEDKAATDGSCEMNEMTSPSRRQFLKLTGAAGLAALSPGLAAPVQAAASAAGAGPRHGLSVFGELKYPSGFRHFDYVNPEAPKGGKFIFQAPSWAYNQNASTFNSFNSFILKGDAPPRMELCFRHAHGPRLGRT